MDGRTHGALLPLGPGDPRLLGGYTLEARLGAGGQATVYLGRTATGEPVAVKVFGAAWLGDPEARQQLSAEIEALRSVPAFGTARLIEAQPDATPAYLVNEYVPGPTLEQAVLRNGPLAGPELDRFALATLTALRAIHGAGLVHRDLKPGNVILGPDGPRIVDFGIVARQGDVEDPSDGVLGTREYLAPELFDGARVERSADLFAWAAMVGFAATGKAPKGADDTLDGVPEGLRGVLRACLATDPTARPDAAAAMDLVLGAASRSTPIEPGAEPATPAAAPNVDPPPLPSAVAPDVAPGAFPPVVPPPLPAAATSVPTDSGIPAWGTPPADAPAPGAARGITPAYGAPSAPRPPRTGYPSAPTWNAPRYGVPVQRRKSKVPGVIVGLVALGIVVAANSGGTNDTGSDPFPQASSNDFSYSDTGSSAQGVSPEEAARAAVVYPEAVTSDPTSPPKVGVLAAFASRESQDPWSVTLSADGRTVTVPDGCALRTWTTTSPAAPVGKPVTVEAIGGSCAPAVSPGGRFRLNLATADQQPTVLRVTDTKTRRTSQAATDLRVDRYVFSADGASLLLADSGNVWQRWDLAKNAPIGDPLPGGRLTYFSAWNADPTLDHVVARVTAGTRIWSFTADAPAASDLPTDQWSGLGGVLSPDGKLLAVIREYPEKQVAVWDVAQQMPVLVVGTDDKVEALAFSPDGRYLALAGVRQTQVVDATTGETVGPLLTYPSAEQPRLNLMVDPAQVQFSADSSHLMLATRAGDVVVWTFGGPAARTP